MVKINLSTKTFIDYPCERCGSKKRISKKWKETIETMTGKSVVDAAQIVCTNNVCQALFDKNRAEELIIIHERKLKKEAQDKIRKEHIAQTIAERKSKKGI